MKFQRVNVRDVRYMPCGFARKPEMERV
jgi:hypothetical protein